MLVLLAALALSAAPAGKEAQAEELAKRSIREYEIGHLTQALADAEQAYLLDPRPVILFNLAQCHRALEHWAEAERLYRNFLRREPRAPNRAAVQKLIVEMMGRQERSEVVPVAPRPLPTPAVAPPTPVKPAEPPPTAAPPRPPRSRSRSAPRPRCTVATRWPTRSGAERWSAPGSPWPGS